MLLSIIVEAIRDFGKISLFAGAICAIVFSFTSFLAARKRWYNQIRRSNGYFSYSWPGETRFGCCGCIVKNVYYMIMVFVAFATTFIMGIIAAAAAATIFLGENWQKCIATSMIAIVISGCSGALGQFTLDKSEDQMLECAEAIAKARRSKQGVRRARRPILS